MKTFRAAAILIAAFSAVGAAQAQQAPTKGINPADVLPPLPVTIQVTSDQVLQINQALSAYPVYTQQTDGSLTPTNFPPSAGEVQVSTFLNGLVNAEREAQKAALAKAKADTAAEEGKAPSPAAPVTPAAPAK